MEPSYSSIIERGTEQPEGQAITENTENKGNPSVLPNTMNFISPQNAGKKRGPKVPAIGTAGKFLEIRDTSVFMTWTSSLNQEDDRGVVSEFYCYLTCRPVKRTCLGHHLSAELTHNQPLHF